MPAQVKITLSADEKKQLEKNVRSKKTSVRLVERSRIILLAAEDIPNYKIADELEIDVNKVGRWRNRFDQKRIQGIEKGLAKRGQSWRQEFRCASKAALENNQDNYTGKTERWYPLDDARSSNSVGDQSFLYQ